MGTKEGRHAAHVARQMVQLREAWLVSNLMMSLTLSEISIPGPSGRPAPYWSIKSHGGLSPTCLQVRAVHLSPPNGIHR